MSEAVRSYVRHYITASDPFTSSFINLGSINFLISVDPDEPEHLDAAVLWRIKLFKCQYWNCWHPLFMMPGLAPSSDASLSYARGYFWANPARSMAAL